MTDEIVPFYWTSWYSSAEMPSFECGWPWWVSGYDAEERDIIVGAFALGSEEEV